MLFNSFSNGTVGDVGSRLDDSAEGSGMEDAEEEATVCARVCVRLLKHPSLRSSDLPGNLLLSLLETCMARYVRITLLPCSGLLECVPACRLGSSEPLVRVMRVCVGLCEELGASALTNTSHALRCIRVRPCLACFLIVPFALEFCAFVVHFNVGHLGWLGSGQRGGR